MMPTLYDAKNWYWVIAGDNLQVYASQRVTSVPDSDEGYQNFLADGSLPTRIASMDELIAVLRAANVAPYHTVSSYRIVRRLEEGGYASAALQVIDAPENAILKARFYTLGTIPADDPDAIAMVIAAGADPDVILAPDSS